MKSLILTIVCILSFTQIRAQHFYYRLDVATNNIYSFAVANLATAGLNTLVDDMLFDNAYTYTYLQTKENKKVLDINGYKITGMTARELFSDMTAGAKLGYQSFYPGAFNWGIFGSAHYRVNQIRTILSGQDENYRHNVQRLLIGGGLLFNLGDVESRTRFVIELGLRHEIPLRYNCSNGIKSTDVINSGLSSHFAIRINGNGALQGLGVYADIPHYRLFKNASVLSTGSNIRMFTFGFVYTITPWKIKDLYDL